MPEPVADDARFGEANRYVRLRCPLCNHTSPVTDQKADVPRRLLVAWWEKHVKTHRPTPIIERAEKPDVVDLMANLEQSLIEAKEARDAVQ